MMMNRENGKPPFHLALECEWGSRTGKMHMMRGVNTSTLCGRSTEEAIIHEGDWVDEILSDPSQATVVCARCRNALAKSPSM